MRMVSLVMKTTLLLMIMIPDSQAAFYSLAKTRKLLHRQQQRHRQRQPVLQRRDEEEEGKKQAPNGTTTTTTTTPPTCPEGYDDDAGLASHPMASQYGLTNCADTFDILSNYMGNADLLCKSLGVGLCNCTCTDITVEASPKLEAVPFASHNSNISDGSSDETDVAISCQNIHLLPDYINDKDMREWKCSPLGEVGVLFWRTNDKEGSITFAVEFLSNGGGAGIGISANGGMYGADLLVVTKEQDEWILRDMFAKGYAYDGSLVQRDKSQDAMLEWIKQDNKNDDDRLAFVVTRPIKSCDDEMDLEILSGPIPVIWARFPSNGIMYHGPGKDNRGTVYLDLLSEDVDTTMIPEDSQDLFTVDMTLTTEEQPFTLPTDQVNTYACKSFELPSDQDYHVVGYEAILDQTDVVHHIVVYSCDEDVYQGTPSECGSMAAMCQTVEIAWAVGMPPQYLPKVAGLPLKRYVLLEMHYENLAGGAVQDGSGIRLTITNQLRQYDFGYVIIGTDLNTQVLEPGQSDAVRQGFCSQDCLARHLPDDGVQIHGQFFHAHLQGRSLSTQLIRADNSSSSTTTTLLGDMPYYDFNHQSFQYFGNEPKLYAGDTLVTTCHYNTSDSPDATRFGLETRDEMCFNVIGMYPKLDTLAYCWNSTTMGGYCGSDWKYMESPLPDGWNLADKQNDDMVSCVKLPEQETEPLSSSSTALENTVSATLCFLILRLVL